MNPRKILSIVGRRTFWRADLVPPGIPDGSGDTDGWEAWVEDDAREERRYTPATGGGVPADANLVSSRLDPEGKLHMPVLDLDFPASLVPSSTPGHFHLYIDKEMDWKTYERLLKALSDAGVIERGYYKASKARKATYVRIPGHTKDNAILPSGAMASHALPSHLAPY